MNLGPLFRDAHRWNEAERSYREAVDLGEALVAAEPTNAAFKHALADYKDNLARLLVFHCDAPVYDPSQAARLAQDATKLVPEKVSFWKPLSLAHYLAGNWRASIEDAMDAAMRCGAGGKLNVPERFAMAKARWRLGEKEAARSLFDQAAAEMAKNQSQDETSLRLCAEAAALFGRTDAITPEDTETKPSK